MKSKVVAYLLWFFLGGLGFHRFYLNKIGTGILWFLTIGLLGIGWFIDLFTLGGQVDEYNLTHWGRIENGSQSHSQPNVTVNVVQGVPQNEAIVSTDEKL